MLLLINLILFGCSNSIILTSCIHEVVLLLILKYVPKCKTSLMINLFLDTGILSMPIVLKEAGYLSINIASQDIAFK